MTDLVYVISREIRYFHALHRFRQIEGRVICMKWSYTSRNGDSYGMVHPLRCAWCAWGFSTVRGESMAATSL